MKRFIATIISIMFAFPVFAKTYLCVGEQTVGFSNENNWEQTRFKPRKYIIDVSVTTVTFRDFDGSINSADICEKAQMSQGYVCTGKPYIDFKNNKKLVSPFGSTHISEDMKRFTTTSTYGYTVNMSGDDVTITVGTCTKI